MKMTMSVLVIALMMAGTSYADMIYDAGSDAGKGGFPDTAGSIIDADPGYDTQFWTYNNAGAALSLSGDSYDVDMGAAAGGVNSYSRVYFEGDDGSGYIGGSASKPVADLGFDIHDPAIEYRIDYRVKVDSVDGLEGQRAVRLYYRGGTSAGNGGPEGGLWAVDIKGVDSTGGGGAADSLSIGFFAGNQAHASFSMGQWHDISMVLKPHAQARPGDLYLDGALVDDRQWGSYWNLNTADAYMYLGNDASGASADFSIDYVNIVGPVPEPTSIVLLGVGGLLLSLRRRRA